MRKEKDHVWIARGDSELLARIAQRHTGEHGIDVEGFLDALTPLDGSMSLTLVATSRPNEIILLKGNMPLEIRIHRRKRVLMYASEPRILDAAIGDEAGWEEMPVASGEALAISIAAIHAPRRLRFAFEGMIRQTAWRRFTGACVSRAWSRYPGSSRTGVIARHTGVSFHEPPSVP